MSHQCNSTVCRQDLALCLLRSVGSCLAKGNVPNVGRLSAFLSCESAKKPNLFLSLSFRYSFSNHFLCPFQCCCRVALLVTSGCEKTSFFQKNKFSQSITFVLSQLIFRPILVKSKNN